MKGRVERWLEESHLTPVAGVEARVQELLSAVRRACERREHESWDAANERAAEEFVAWLQEAFPGRVRVVDRPDAVPHGEPAEAPPEPGDTPTVLVERQRLRPLARRTTTFNYAFTVAGRSPERLVLVAHYDTWRGPGADDNTTGEEIVKQYLLSDLRAPGRPPLTHTYLLAGSEECGLIGFTSQLVLGVGLALVNVAWAHGVYAVMGLAALLVPLAAFRFGVSGSREYVRSLSPGERQRVRAAVSVDSVGEGSLYIPDSALGATFLRAFLPLAGHEVLNDTLQEAAHLHGICYSTFLAGGTTDHISFLEAGRPGAALVALLPGKASPLVWGGKIHTKNDTPDRVYPKPLGETLRVLDTWLHLAQGGARLREPRALDEFHYARLYRLPSGEVWLALKDAVEPNRRNLNAVYRVALEERDGVARCRPLEAVGWGVETQLDREVRDLSGGRCRRLEVARLDVLGPEGTVSFAARPGRTWARVQAGVSWLIGRLEGLIGTHSFVAFFGAAFLLARVVELVMMEAFRWEAFQKVFFDWFYVTLPLTLVAQVMMVVYLVAVRMPHLADQSYAHMNRADNLSSLRRTRSHDA